MITLGPEDLPDWKVWDNPTPFVPDAKDKGESANLSDPAEYPLYNVIAEPFSPTNFSFMNVHLSDVHLFHAFEL